MAQALLGVYYESKALRYRPTGPKVPYRYVQEISFYWEGLEE